MNTSATQRQLFPCSTPGCAALLVSPGTCFKCTDQIAALDRIAAKPSGRSFFDDVMTFAALALLVYILFQFVSMFADWWALGGRPWQ